MYGEAIAESRKKTPPGSCKCFRCVCVNCNARIDDHYYSSYEHARKQKLKQEYYKDKAKKEKKAREKAERRASAGDLHRLESTILERGSRWLHEAGLGGHDIPISGTRDPSRDSTGSMAIRDSDSERSVKGLATRGVTPKQRSSHVDLPRINESSAGSQGGDGPSRENFLIPVAPLERHPPTRHPTPTASLDQVKARAIVASWFAPKQKGPAEKSPKHPPPDEATKDTKSDVASRAQSFTGAIADLFKARPTGERSGRSPTELKSPTSAAFADFFTPKHKGKPPSFSQPSQPAQDLAPGNPPVAPERPPRPDAASKPGSS